MKKFIRTHSQTLNIPEGMYKGYTHPLCNGNPFRGDETKDEVLQIIMRSALNDCLLVSEHCLYYFAMDKFPEYELNHIIVEYICRDEYAYNYIGVWDGIIILHSETGEVLASYNWDIK